MLQEFAMHCNATLHCIAPARSVGSHFSDGWIRHTVQDNAEDAALTGAPAQPVGTHTPMPAERHCTEYSLYCSSPTWSNQQPVMLLRHNAYNNADVLEL
jgi:hypothetical protein